MRHLPRVVRDQIEGGFIPDRNDGPRGPITLARSFLDALKQIDPRLVVRWNEMLGCYGVFTKMEGSRWLWDQAVHWIRDEFGRFRVPDQRDLNAIRKAKYVMEHTGYKAWIENLDRIMNAQNKLAAEIRDKSIRDYAEILARKYDLTIRDFQVRSRVFTNAYNRFSLNFREREKAASAI